MSQPEFLKSALERQVRRLGIARHIARGRVLALWPKVVGDQIATRSKAESMSEGTLTVVVPDATWRHELSYQKKTLVQRLNEAAGEKVVTDIFFVAVSKKKA